jgi:unsaturated rhamnogalacturonyl hydrolase
MRKNCLKYAMLLAMLVLAQYHAVAQEPWSAKLSRTAMRMWPDSFSNEGKPARWSYDQGVILKGIEALWYKTGDVTWFKYLQHSMDHYVRDDGTIKDYRPDEYNIDHINNGKSLLMLYRVTGKEKYLKAVRLIRNQLLKHPRTSEGGFWHKQIYPYQMWLDGLYMGQPFYAEYASLFHEDTAFNDIAKQFILMERHARDAKTGLLYHGWDESRQQQWADKQTGRSPHVWARALGWYGMAMVDALDYFPQQHAGRDSVVAILKRFAKAVTAVQDPATGLWYDVVDVKGNPKNYHESSASCMLTYALLKGVRKGYLPASYLPAAKKAYAGILKKFIETDANGYTNLKGTVKVSGLGGKPYRDGSFDYYMSEPVITNDAKGMGAFIKASVEMEILPTLPLGKGKKVVLDQFFNNEWRKDATGTPVRWHYVWEEKSHPGFFTLGQIFERYGVKTASLPDAPTAANLKGARMYIIADPDTEKETPKPNYIEEAHINAIEAWVKSGGVLLLMGNDAGNAEFTHFNKLAARFGVQFNEDSKNRVQGELWEQGSVMAEPGNPIFKSARKTYIKEYASLQVKTPAKTVLTNGSDNVMAVAKVGKGTVIMVGDPWFYCEYVDGRRLPATFDNYKAAEDMVRWAVTTAMKGK